MSVALYPRFDVPESKRSEEGKRVAQALKELREAAGQTQEETARLVNLTHAGYRPYEQGKRTLTVKQINTFAAAFGVSPDALAARVGLAPTDSKTLAFSADMEVFQHQLTTLPPDLAASLLEMWRSSLTMVRQARRLREN